MISYLNGNSACIIIGAGPAGLAAAGVLVDAGLRPIIIDKMDTPGGLSRSIHREGNIFDVGPHRFFTKSEEVLQLWRARLLDDLMMVNRLTRILYNGVLFNYPLSAMNALMGLGIGTATHAFAGYGYTRIKRRLRPRMPESFEDWVTDNFGPVLYDAFFRHYTEKVWGVPCSQISADWASQRIKGLNLAKAILNALTNHRSSQVKTLVDHFIYPKFGAGWLYSRMMDHAIENGAEYIPNSTVTKISRNNDLWDVTYRRDGRDSIIPAKHVISSAPVTELVQMLSPEPSAEVREACAKLRFRNHYCVNLVIKNSSNLFPDNWIYVHSPEMRIGRIANYANFSKNLQVAPNLFPVTAEFFSFYGDDFDLLEENAKIDLAVDELTKMGLRKKHQTITDAFTVFSPSAYPVIEIGYEDHIRHLRDYIRRLDGLQTVGRAGLFQYNNQDHSIMTGLLAARNILGADYDVWGVNIDAEYHESGTAPALCERDKCEVKL